MRLSTPECGWIDDLRARNQDHLCQSQAAGRRRRARDDRGNRAGGAAAAVAGSARSKSVRAKSPAILAAWPRLVLSAWNGRAGPRSAVEADLGSAPRVD